jgi:hypothetical protein
LFLFNLQAHIKPTKIDALNKVIAPITITLLEPVDGDDEDDVVSGINSPVGFPVGCPVGFPVGCPVGFPVGCPVGFPVG